MGVIQPAVEGLWSVTVVGATAGDTTPGAPESGGVVAGAVVDVRAAVEADAGTGMGVGDTAGEVSGGVEGAGDRDPVPDTAGVGVVTGGPDVDGDGLWVDNEGIAPVPGATGAVLVSV